MPKSLKKTREENTITKPENKENPSSRSQSLYPPCYEIALADSQLAQQKLKMGQQDDQYEREADAIADKVVRGNPKDFPLAKQITPLDGANSESGFQTVPASVEKQINASKGGGVPLPEHTRVQMEEAFGVDFSGVRIHTNRQGIEINNVLNSKAFTYQGNIYFNHLNNKFNTFEEQKLVAHELTHTLQQTNGQPTIQTKSTKSKRKRNPKKRRYRRKKRGWNREEVASDHMIVLFKPFADPKKYLHFQSYVYSAILRHMEFMNLPLHWGPDLLGSKKGI